MLSKLKEKTKPTLTLLNISLDTKLQNTVSAVYC